MSVSVPEHLPAAEHPPVDRRAPARRPASPVPVLLVPVLLLPLADVLALAAAAVLAGVPAASAVLYAAAVLALLRADGQHRLRICRRVSDQFPRTGIAAAAPLPALSALAGAGTGLRLGLCAAALLLVARAGACAGVRAAHRRGRLLEPALIVGTGATAVRIARLLYAYPTLGLEPVGFLDERQPVLDVPLPVLGAPDELADTVRRHRVRRVIVCYPATPDADVVALLRACRPLPADVCLVPRLYELGAALPKGCLDELWGIPLVPLRRLGHSRVALAAKSTFDRAAATVLLVALSPLLLALAAAIRVRCDTDALFRQTRVSTGGRPVPVLKLRTMLPHADSDTRWAVPAGYISRFGRWLRATHLDELPQLVNVARGHMSLVGPRPERPHFAARFGALVPRYTDRQRMPAGMTGWAQVHGLHGDTSIEDRVHFDNQYIEYWSPWLDLVILARTLGTMRPRPRQPGSTPSLPTRPATARPVTSAPVTSGPVTSGPVTTHGGRE